MNNIFVSMNNIFVLFALLYCRVGHSFEDWKCKSRADCCWYYFNCDGMKCCSGRCLRGGCGDGGSDDGCFAAHSTVIEKTLGVISMEELAVGDSVQTGQEFSKVVGWLHKDPKYMQPKFMEIEYADSLSKFKNITVTGEHHVRISSGAFVEARDVKIGSQLVGADGSAKKVVDVRELGELVGYYAPLTASGTIVVDGIQCSVYAYGPEFEWFMLLSTWPWRSGLLKLHEDTDLFTVAGWIPRFYLTVVRMFKTTTSPF